MLEVRRFSIDISQSGDVPVPLNETPDPDEYWLIESVTVSLPKEPFLNTTLGQSGDPGSAVIFAGPPFPSDWPDFPTMANDIMRFFVDVLYTLPQRRGFAPPILLRSNEYLSVHVPSTGGNDVYFVTIQFDRVSLL